MQPFQVGHVVKLKSGGPEMTIRAASVDRDTGDVKGFHCQWFAGKKLEEGYFAASTIEPATPKTPLPSPTGSQP